MKEDMIYVVEIMDAKTSYVIGAYSSAARAHEVSKKYIEEHYTSGLIDGGATYVVTTVVVDHPVSP